MKFSYSELPASSRSQEDSFAPKLKLYKSLLLDFESNRAPVLPPAQYTALLSFEALDR
jgi:hypothetical protein